MQRGVAGVGGWACLLVLAVACSSGTTPDEQDGGSGGGGGRGGRGGASGATGNGGSAGNIAGAGGAGGASTGGAAGLATAGAGGAAGQATAGAAGQAAAGAGGGAGQATAGAGGAAGQATAGAGGAAGQAAAGAGGVAGQATAGASGAAGQAAAGAGGAAGQATAGAGGGAGQAVGGGGGAAGAGGSGGTASCDSVCEAGETCVKGICRGPISRWTTVGGNVHRSGFNANETGTPPLSPAWTVGLANRGGLWPVVSDGTRLYVTENGYFDSLTRMWALDPSTGQTAWKYDFGDIYNLGQPTVDRGYVYVARCSSSSTYMYSFVASAGTLLWSLPFPSQFDDYWAPLVTPEGNIYFNGGTYGGFYGLRASNGTQLFFNGSLEQWDAWAPTFLGGQIYTFIAGRLRVHDRLTNAVLSTVTVQNPWNGTAYSMNAAPVSDGEKIYLVAPPSLHAYLPGKSTPEWTATGAYKGMPAVANGVVYTTSGGQLRANDASNGNILWTFAADSALSLPPVVAGRFVYVSSTMNAYAFDTMTQQVAWTTSPGGWLSIANGHVYVARADGTLAAFKLTPAAP